MANTFTGIELREIDFVSRFSKNWDALKEILGIMNAIKKTAGTKLVSYTAEATNGLAQSPAAGEAIPTTAFTVTEVAHSDLTIEKYSKSATIEDVAKYGAKIAVEKTDDAFLNELQSTVMTRFYNFLKTGTLTGTEATFQMALSMAKGLVLNKFKGMHKSVTNVVAFVNVLDVYQYIGAANITTQTAFGIEYLKDFMGYSTIFLLSNEEIPRGKVFATAVENIDLYYLDPSDSEIEDSLGLSYRTDGDTNLIGFHAEGDYRHATGESFAVMGMALWAEYLDGIANVTVGTAGTGTGTGA